MDRKPDSGQDAGRKRRSMKDVPRALLDAATKDKELAASLADDEQREQIVAKYHEMEAFYTRQYGGRGKARRGLTRKDSQAKRRRLRSLKLQAAMAATPERPREDRAARRIRAKCHFPRLFEAHGRARAEEIAEDRRTSRSAGRIWTPPWQVDPGYTRRARNMRRNRRQQIARSRAAR